MPSIGGVSFSAPDLRYLGRLAPSPTGLLHLGHARTFWVAGERARLAGGRLLLRNDDLDPSRCRADYVDAMVEDLRWLGLTWLDPMITQSARLERYRDVLRLLHARGLVYPCSRSRKDVADAAGAPHEGGEQDEPVYPREWRPPEDQPLPSLEFPTRTHWRFRVPDDEKLRFKDGATGWQEAVAGVDFGDFIVWRKDDLPSYQLASAVDDADAGVTEIVRGADLIRSTFRQLLLWRALGWHAPAFWHCPLLCDEAGQRLAKRHDALALRTLREQGLSAEALRERFASELGSLLAPRP